METTIRQVVTNYTGGGDVIAEVKKLYGDASYRTYFRVFLVSGKTLIVMKLPDGISSASEEITNYEGKKNELPYINISNYLRSLKLPVPQILFYDKREGMIILEDIGDHLFVRDVDGAGDDLKLSKYKEAIDLLCLIQDRAKERAGCIAFKRSFDEKLLNWEFDHFLEYGIEVRFGAGLGDDIKKRFTGITRSISEEIAKTGYIFTHRDFQSRNLMFKDSKLYFIDFQDALMGPVCYDLVALTRDSYVEIDDGLLDKLISYYVSCKGYSAESFRRIFDLVTIQRKLKDAGRFVYIDKVKGNPNYLKNIPRSLEYVKKALLRQGEYSELFEILKPYIFEWG